jgi:GT2 family glycosyltransferase
MSERHVALSVVIATAGRTDLLCEQLAALAQQASPVAWEVVVADNLGGGGSVAAVARFRTDLDVRVVDASGRRGAAHARNVGVRAARGELVAFLDDDDVVADGWLAAIVAALAEHDVVAARVDSDFLNEDWIVAVRGRPQNERLWAWYRSPSMTIAFGGTIALSRAAHDAVGGFDETLPTHEDADYVIRLRNAGYDVHFEREAVVYVRHRQSLGSIFRQSLFYGEALPAFYRKHVPLGLRRPPRSAAFRGWGSVVRLLLSVRGRTSFGRFLWQLGWRVGLVRGSFRHRYLLLSE